LFAKGPLQNKNPAYPGKNMVYISLKTSNINHILGLDKFIILQQNQ